MNDKFKTLQPQIIDWAEQKGILKKATPSKQLLKTKEEMLELINAMVDNDHEEIKDAIGDTLVTLIIYSKMKRFDLNNLINNEHALSSTAPDNPFAFLHEVENVVNRLFVCEIYAEKYSSEEYYWATYLIHDAITSLNYIANFYSLNIWYCLESAYNEIKNRTGKMINGTFVKDK